MRIGIDISQIVYEGSGVGRIVRSLVAAMVTGDQKNDYILFGSSLRLRPKIISYFNSLKSRHSKIRLVVLPLPPTVLDFVWNKLHIFPIEWLVGPVDVFWSSDWTQPPLASAKGVTTVHDLAVLRYPESFTGKIVSVQKRRLKQVARECSAIFCDSAATLADCRALLGISMDKLHVVYPGLSQLL